MPENENQSRVEQLIRVLKDILVLKKKKDKRVATKFKEDSKIKREIKVYGIVLPVNVEIDGNGLAFRVAGTKKAVVISWHRVVTAAQTPGDVPSYLMGEPLKFLQRQAIDLLDRKEKASKKRT
jgi:hypothetical protein